MKPTPSILPHVGGRQFFSRPCALLLAALAFVVLRESRTLAATDAVASNRPPRLVAAVLPFENKTGDAALDDWRQALPALVRSCLGLAELTGVPGWKKLEPSLTRAGWTDAKAVDPELARQVARDLKAGLAIWGSFRRQTNGWALDARVLRADSGAPPESVRLSEPNPVKLAESLAFRLAIQWERPVSAAQQAHWRMTVTETDAGASTLAHALAVQLRQAPATEQERAWREVVAAEPCCGQAYSALINLLIDAGRNDEIEILVGQWSREQPRSCVGHAANSLRLEIQSDLAGAETELREALRLHPGCSTALRRSFNLFANSERWTDLVAILKDARARRPDAEFIQVLLADALAQSGHEKGARDLLDSFEDLPEEDALVDLALLQAAFTVGPMELAGRVLQRLGPQVETSESIRRTLESFVLVIPQAARSRTNAPVTQPRRITPVELDAELERRLTSEERKLVVNPLEITPDVTAEARRLTVGLTNAGLQAIALYADVARRGRGTGDTGIRTAGEALRDSGDPETRFACQEHAKLFVALARALGLEAWLVHVDRCADGSPAYHDCAAFFLGGRGLLVDPTWRAFGIAHEEFAVLDDVQAISHQAMQPGAKPDAQHLRLGLKLNPEDRWTRIQFVRGMARVGDWAAAEEELRGVRSTGAETWDVPLAAAELEIARERWRPALAELQQALALNPSNALVHFRLSGVYGALRNEASAETHMRRALELDRGEFSKELRRETEFDFKVMDAFSEAKSGAPGSREALQRRAEAGDLAAQVAMAHACFNDRPPRLDKGMRWLLMAAEQGNDQAQFNYAKNLLLLRGRTAAEEAVKWLKRSADQGNADAQYLLGKLLYEGKFVARDNVAAGQWILVASGTGHREAKSLLWQMELFLAPAELAEARRRAETFKPLKTQRSVTRP